MDENTQKTDTPQTPPPFLSNDTKGLKRVSHETIKILLIIDIVIDALAVGYIIYLNVLTALASHAGDGDAGAFTIYSIILAVTVGIPMLIVTTVLTAGYFSTQPKDQIN